MRQKVICLAAELSKSLTDLIYMGNDDFLRVSLFNPLGILMYILNFNLSSHILYFQYCPLLQTGGCKQNEKEMF